jgi:hypothetical protein
MDDQEVRLKRKDSGVIGISHLADLHKGKGQGASTQVSTPPETPTEIKLAAIWQSALPGVPFFR